MKKKKYPLSQIVEIKKRRLEDAEIILKMKRSALEAAEKDLKEKRKKLNETQKLKLETIEKHFKKISEGTTSDVLKRHETYMKEVIEVKITEEKKAVDEQKKVVKEAERELEAARIDRLKKNQELEKIYMHKKEWTKEIQKEMVSEEAALGDELGTSMHARKSKKRH